MQDFRDLRVWQEAHALALNVHRVAKSIRGPSYVSLRSQLMRAANSVAANIVEGRAQRGDREFARFLRIAAASAAELEYHIVFGADIDVIENVDAITLQARVTIVRKMLHNLIQSLR